jgi:hypothetical protein
MRSGGGRPIRAKTYGSVLHAIWWGGGNAALYTSRKAQSASDACIARNVIPRVRPPIYCVQYAGTNRDIASNVDWAP